MFSLIVVENLAPFLPCPVPIMPSQLTIHWVLGVSYFWNEEPNLCEVILLLISSACVFNVELEENDLEDSRSCEAPFDVDNSSPKVLAEISVP